MTAIIGELEKRGARYTAEDIDGALTVVALYAGRTQLAAEALAKHGTPIPQSTLDAWKHHPDGRYDRVCAEQAPRIGERAAQLAEAVVLQASELESELLDQMRAHKHDIKPSELAGALRNVTTTKALNMDKVVNPLRNRPSTITEHRDAHNILDSLVDMLPPAINSTAIEETPALKEAEPDTTDAFSSGASRSERAHE